MTRSSTPILPGAVVGVLGSGQLGRMFTIAARQMGYRVHTLSPETDTPTGQVADVEITASYQDLDAVRKFAQSVQVVTFEFENVPSSAVEVAARFAPVRPDGSVLYTTQHRLREKQFLTQKGFPTAPFAPIRFPEDVTTAVQRIGYPALLKTAGFGYDGKGQIKVSTPAEVGPAVAAAGIEEMILEAFIDFEVEFSVVAARALDGSVAHWGVIENRHCNRILDLSLAPATLPDKVVREALEIAESLLETLGVVGVLCVEFFVTRDEKILINELAPRPHNSGHLTIDASVTSQFEQQLRTVCGLPLGATEFFSAAVMANLLGDLWAGGEPDWAAAAAVSDVKIHLYGKSEPRVGRKMGHLTALAQTPEAAMQRVLSCRRRLMRN